MLAFFYFYLFNYEHMLRSMFLSVRFVDYCLFSEIFTMFIFIFYFLMYGLIYDLRY